MFTHVSVKDFKAVPYLETSLLYQAHPEGITFSLERPNVIVGPNGAGKSALLKTLSIKTLSYLTGESTFDGKYINTGSGDHFWNDDTATWRRDYQFLKGLTCEGDRGPALYYRPGHIPGNDHSISAAMMCGYFDEAKAFGRLTDNKSSGQQSQALLQKFHDVLSGQAQVAGYGYLNWSYGKEPRELDRRFYSGSLDDKAEIFKADYAGIAADAIPVLLGDEPEQSLDAKAEALLWKRIADCDCSRVQLIVATHSLYPMLHPERFNLIEAVPGYAEEVRALL
jgi:ABC-type cobalamin/Fe3+-siderophores transport system ATPase subunit